MVLGLPEAGNHLLHDAFVALGVLAAVVVFVLQKRRHRVTDDRLWVVVAMGLGWGALFSRLGTWAQHLDPGENAPVVQQWLYGNRSILGGLAGAYLGVLFGKRVTGYRQRTGDLFAPAVAVGMALGRVGCLLTETPGTPTGASWGVVLTPAQAAALPGGPPDGVPLHPSFAYEIAFQVVAAALLWRYRDGIRRPGALFTCYLAGYAVFRFAVELVRGNEVVWAGMTRPQLVLLPFVPLLVWRAAVVLRAARTQPHLSTEPEPETAAS